MKNINKNIGVPLYEQVMEAISDDIKNEVYTYGQIIPKENDLCKIYSVSNRTIKRALDILVQSGVLRRVKGKGTYVLYQKIKQEFTHVIKDFSEELLQRGIYPKTVVIEKKVVPSNKTLQEKLCLTKNEKVLKIVRLRYANDEPLLVLTTYLPYTRNQFLLDKNFENISIYDYFKEENIKLKRVNRVFEVQKIDKKNAELLTINPNEPVLYFETMAFTDNDLPIEFSRCIYRGDRNKFVVDIKL